MREKEEGKEGGGRRNVNVGWEEGGKMKEEKKEEGKRKGGKRERGKEKKGEERSEKEYTMRMAPSVRVRRT